MKAILDYIHQAIQLPRLALTPSFIAFSNTEKAVNLKSNQSFFVAKDFAKHASYFFRIDSSQEEEIEVIKEEKKPKPKLKTVNTIKMDKTANETKIDSQDLNYTYGLKYVLKLLIFPVVFCWIVLETAFEFIVDSDEEEVSVKAETTISASGENSYQPS